MVVKTIFLSYCTHFESHVSEAVWASFKNKEILQKQYLMFLGKLLYLTSSNLRSQAVLTKVPRKIFTKIRPGCANPGWQQNFQMIEINFTNLSFAPDNIC